jgi:hypothetical protein
MLCYSIVSLKLFVDFLFHDMISVLLPLSGCTARNWQSDFAPPPPTPAKNHTTENITWSAQLEILGLKELRRQMEYDIPVTCNLDPDQEIANHKQLW